MKRSFFLMIIIFLFLFFKLYLSIYLFVAGTQQGTQRELGTKCKDTPLPLFTGFWGQCVLNGRAQRRAWLR